MPSASDVSLPPRDPDGRASCTLLAALGNGVLFVLAVDPEEAFAGEAPAHPACFFSGGTLLDLPNGLGLSWRHDGETHWFRPRPDQLQDASRHLCLDDGVSRREALVLDDAGRQTRWRETRLVSLSHAGVVLLRWELEPLNWHGGILVRSQLDLRAVRPMPHPAWAHAGAPEVLQNLLPDDGLAARVAGPDDRQLRVDVTLRTSGATCRQAGRGHDADWSYQQRQVEVPAGTTLTIDVAMTVSEDPASPVPVPGFEQERERQRAAWQSLWERVQLFAPRDPALERACRFAAYHLLQAVSPLSVGRDVGLPAWSATAGAPWLAPRDEAVALPFYSLRLPALARELLHHRARRRDPEAQPAARWATVFAAWRHHLATRDAALLGAVTGPLLVDAARAWAAGGTQGGVLGAWALCRAAALPEVLDAAVWTRLRTLSNVEDEEVQRWGELGCRQAVAWDGDGNPRLGGTDGVDTAMLLHLFGAADLAETLGASGDALPDGWYGRTARRAAAGQPPTGGLAGVALAGALAGVDPAASWSHFQAVLHGPLAGGPALDDGLSLAAMAGAWDVLQRHYFGLQPGPDGLHLRPAPPDGLDGVTMRVALGGHGVSAGLAGRLLSLQVEPGGAPLTVHHAGEQVTLEPGVRWSVACR